MCVARTRNIKGMVLLEVMSAACLSLFLIASMTTLYLKCHHAMLQQRVIYRQQDIAEKMIALFNAEIGLAGHVGCARLGSGFVVQPYHSKALTVDNYLEVHPDRLIVRYQSLPSSVLLESTHHKIRAVTDDAILFQKNEWLLISDCHRAEIFFSVAVSHAQAKQVIAPFSPLHDDYSQNAEIGRYIVHDYHLKNIHGHSSLVRVDDAGNVISIAKDVESLSFKADSQGVQYSFTTHAHGVSEKWVGYAQKN